MPMVACRVCGVEQYAATSYVGTARCTNCDRPLDTAALVDDRELLRGAAQVPVPVARQHHQILDPNAEAAR
jgi:hypothetical protein